MVLNFCSKQQVQMYYRSGTAGHQQTLCVIFIHQVATPGLGAGNDVAVIVCMKWHHEMAAILKLWGQIKNPTLLVNTYLCKELSFKISSQSDLKLQSLRLFWKTKKKKNNNNKMSSNRRSVPGLNIDRLWRDGVWNCFVVRWSGWCTGSCLHCSPAWNSSLTCLSHGSVLS